MATAAKTTESRNRPLGPPIDRDAFCVSCSYNLRAHCLGGRCPECGAPISASIRCKGLLACGPDYIRKLLWGVGLALTGICTFLFALGFAVVIDQESSGWVVFLSLIPSVAGDFLLSTRNPQLHIRPWKRLWLRIAAGIKLAAGLVFAAFADLMPEAYVWFVVAAMVVVLFARLNLLRNLSDPELRYDASFAMVAWLCCLGATVISLITLNLDLSGLAPLAIIFTAISFIGFIAAGLFYFVVLALAIGALRAELHASRILLHSDQPVANEG